MVSSGSSAELNGVLSSWVNHPASKTVTSGSSAELDGVLESWVNYTASETVIRRTRTKRMERLGTITRRTRTKRVKWLRRLLARRNRHISSVRSKGRLRTEKNKEIIVKIQRNIEKREILWEVTNKLTMVGEEIEKPTELAGTKEQGLHVETSERVEKVRV
ncbi:predicted protein [Arabidopsis lyrata subsp. lyrata]|uniref:Predicted protein n=1 Tax=Arabidopsis lyrata subsp. lyrata TaxID=81972 RepID=D7L5C6_ARALL|nr:predicted protein [Arabidopsis lyrata subsp. lyrata]